MSGWVDFVVAERADAERIADLADPKQVWPGVEYKFVSPAELAQLGHVCGDDAAAAIAETDFETLIRDDRGWVFAFPTALTTAVAGLRTDDLARIAVAWLAATGRREVPENATDFLDGLRDVARQAVAGGKVLVARQDWS